VRPTAAEESTLSSNRLAQSAHPKRCRLRRQSRLKKSCAEIDQYMWASSFTTRRAVRFRRSGLVVEVKKVQKREAAMRIFGRSKITNPSAFRRTGSSASGQVQAAQAAVAPVDLAITDEMPIVREISPVLESQTGASHDEDGDSDVFVCRRSSPDLGAEAAVTLFVYGWENVEPGPLSWAFPSLRMALDAVKTMRNAIEWCIVAGHEWSSIDAARESGAVLIEQNA
jgi:hypothetical protein